MRKTRLILAALFCAVAMLTCSCDYASVESNTEESVSMFVQVEKAEGWRVVYHRDTKVVYTVSTGSYNYGSFTLLVNPDGSPMLWEGE